MAQTVLITGNTYPVKDAIKALGGRWNPDSKGWLVPAAKADEAQALVAGAPAKSPRSNSGRSNNGYRRSSHPRTGCSCGSREGMTQPGDCWTCRFDETDC